MSRITGPEDSLPSFVLTVFLHMEKILYYKMLKLLTHNIIFISTYIPTPSNLVTRSWLCSGSRPPPTLQWAVGTAILAALPELLLPVGC